MTQDIEKSVKELTEKAKTLQLTLLTAALEEGPNAWNDKTTPTTLVGLCIPVTLVNKIRVVSDALIQAEERNTGKTPIGVRADIESAFLTSLILTGIVAQTKDLLDESTKHMRS